MGIGDRLEEWGDHIGEVWGGRFGSWLGSTLSSGITKFLEEVEPFLLDFAGDTLKVIRDDENTPDWVKALLNKLLPGDQLWQVILIAVAAPFIIIPMITGVVQPLAKLLNYGQEIWFRSYRLDPLSWVTLFRRFRTLTVGEGENAVDKYRADLVAQGWSDERIELLKSITLYYPAPADLVRWQAREVFEPSMVEKYGLDDELGEIEREPFYKAGMDDEQIRNYWRAHWEHASWFQVVEMLRRTDFSEQDLREWFRVVEIPPFWRDKLIATSYEVPTRVDVRRWWDMRTITEARLREIYEHQGYHGVDLEDYIIWTKVYTDFPVQMARFRNGWITEQEVRQWLIDQGVPPERVELFMQEKLEAEKPERTAAERDLTKTDIYRGVKQGVITRAQAVELLVELGYDVDEAEYILDINAPPDEEEPTIALRQLSKSDILKALKEDLITAATARQRLLDLRYSATDADLILAIFQATIKPPVEPEARELAKGDITGALRRGILSPDEARDMLLELRYSTDDARFLVEANLPPEEEAAIEEARRISKADIMKALLARVISDPEASARLEGIGYTSEDAAWLVTLYLTVADIAAAPVSREASKADIVLAVKKGLLTPEEAYLMLQGIDFSPFASQFILQVRAESSPFSPRSLEEFRERTAMYRRAVTMNEPPGPPGIREAGAEVVRLQDEVARLQEEVRLEERELVAGVPLPENVLRPLTELRVQLNRTVTELEEARRAYENLVETWRRSGPETAAS